MLTISSTMLTMNPDSSDVAELFIMWTVLEGPGDTSRLGDSEPASQDWGLTEPLRNEPDFDLIRTSVFVNN